MVFGSLARNEWDRWSDVDLIVVTSTQAQFEEVFTRFLQWKPILHHSPLTLRAEADGAYILGNVFVDESVFHCLDLNFLSVTQVQLPAALQRFKQLQTLYSAKDTPVDDERELIQSLSPPAEDPVEKRINEAFHFTKKTLKKVLRHKATIEELQPFANHLMSVMQDYPADIVVPGGRIGHLAHTYLEMTQALLTGQ